MALFLTGFLIGVVAWFLGWAYGERRAIREFDAWFEGMKASWEPEALMYRFAVGFRERVEAEPNPVIRKHLELHAEILERLYIQRAKAKA